MKLLFDQNLSDRIIPRVIDLYPGSQHVKALGLDTAENSTIWNYAISHDFTILSKDSDFHQRGLLLGHPPKFIYLRIGNCPTIQITELLRSRYASLMAFEQDPDASIFVLQ